MVNMITELIKHNSQAIIALVGVLAGHVLTITLPFIQRRNERIEASNKLIYWLLELWWVADKTYLIEYVEQVKKIFPIDGVNISEADIKDQIKQFGDTFFKDLRDKNIQAQTKASEGIGQHLPTLMNFDPLLAFKISDYANPSNPIDYDSKMNEFLSRTFEQLNTNNKLYLRLKLGKLFGDALDENTLSADIQRGILSLALSNGIYTYVKLWRYLAQKKTIRKKDAKKVASEIRTIIQASASMTNNE